MNFARHPYSLDFTHQLAENFVEGLSKNQDYQYKANIFKVSHISKLHYSDTQAGKQKVVLPGKNQYCTGLELRKANH